MNDFPVETFFCQPRTSRDSFDWLNLFSEFDAWFGKPARNSQETGLRILQIASSLQRCSHEEFITTLNQGFSVAFAKFSFFALAVACLSSSNLALAGSLDLTTASDNITINFTQDQNKVFASDPATGYGTPYVDSEQYIFLNQTLNGSPSSLFCVDLGTLVYDSVLPDPDGLGKSYSTTVRNDGTVDSLNTKYFNVTGNLYATDTKGTVTGAQQIAWLVEKYAPSAKSDVERLALQAAIWKAEYGKGFDLVKPGDQSSTSDKVYEAYSNYIDRMESAAVSGVAWYSPTTQDGAAVQGFVGIDVGIVPEPSSFVLALFGVVGICVAPSIKRRMHRKQLMPL